MTRMISIRRWIKEWLFLIIWDAVAGTACLIIAIKAPLPNDKALGIVLLFAVIIFNVIGLSMKWTGSVWDND